MNDREQRCSFKLILAEVQARETERRELMVYLCERPVVFAGDDGEEPMKLVAVHRNTHPERLPWRVSYLQRWPTTSDPWEPTGHSEAPDYVEAIKTAHMNGARTSRIVRIEFQNS